MTTAGTINFDHVGIGKALSVNRLKVPLNQREYSWKEEHVEELFEDFKRAIINPEAAYFLGTVVLTQSGGTLEVADGQQRLGTVTILLAAIRDEFFWAKSDMSVQSIENEFLTVIDRVFQKHVPRLELNVDDNEFFRRAILLRPDQAERKTAAPSRGSHHRIAAAQAIAAKHVRSLTTGRSDAGKMEILNHWVEFLAHGAQVIVLTVPGHLDAFRMFETLNDRGLKTSQSDLLKNYLFGEAKNRLPEAQQRWSGMVGTLESCGEDDITVTYLRHFLVAKNGAVRERDVYDKIKDTVTGPFAAIELLDDLTHNANSYVALMNHSHEHWAQFGQYSTQLRKHVATLIELRVEQIRPLMLACMKTFTPKETERAFRMFIWWSVRFIVAGAPSGNVEKYYAGRAAEVWKQEITTAADLAKVMAKNLPDDDTFKSAFRSLRVSKSYLARYFLRSLERAAKDDPAPEHVVNDDPTVLTLEHVLPENPSGAWSHINPELAQIACRRLGNMVLLRANANSTAGNAGFEDKKKIYKDSTSLLLTKEVVTSPHWGPDEINARQERMAELAVKAWPAS